MMKNRSSHLQVIKTKIKLKNQSEPRDQKKAGRVGQSSSNERYKQTIMETKTSFEFRAAGDLFNYDDLPEIDWNFTLPIDPKVDVPEIPVTHHYQRNITLLIVVIFVKILLCWFWYWRRGCCNPCSKTVDPGVIMVRRDQVAVDNTIPNFQSCPPYSQYDNNYSVNHGYVCSNYDLPDKNEEKCSLTQYFNTLQHPEPKSVVIGISEIGQNDKLKLTEQVHM